MASTGKTSHVYVERHKVVQAQRVYEVGSHWFGVGYIAANLMLDDLLTYMGSST